MFYIYICIYNNKKQTPKPLGGIRRTAGGRAAPLAQRLLARAQPLDAASVCTYIHIYIYIYIYICIRMYV